MRAGLAEISLAASRIAAGLSTRDIALLRFDFTGIGSSEGEFANTNFSSNVGDLVAAVNFLRSSYAAPHLLIGHSLGEYVAAALAGVLDLEDALLLVAERGRLFRTHAVGALAEPVTAPAPAPAPAPAGRN